MTNDTFTRRAFLAAMTTTAASAGANPLVLNIARVIPGRLSPNEKLNIACIGNGGMGETDTFSCNRENLVALCDVDPNRAASAYERFPDVPKFTDYREMLEKMKEIDAVTVSTPDHTHAPAAYTAMKLGKHVYVQKPLTHTIAETKLLMRTADESGVATQMGNQGHSGSGVRELCEMLWSGAIGPVHEAHAWTFRPQGKWPQGIAEVPPPMEAPPNLAWDLWLGSGLDRPYNEIYHPRNWRGWYDFGNGALGDMGCHVLDPAYMALKLGEAPGYTIEIVRSSPRNAITFPLSQVLKFSFPERVGMPPVDVYWYDGGELPPLPEGVSGADLGSGDWPAENDGSYFVGESGVITAGTYGQTPRLVPEARMKDYAKPDPILPRVEGSNHYRNWFDACKGGPAASSSFSYSGPFTMMILLGGIAMRSGQKVVWDNGTQTITSLPDAADWMTKTYRKGWELPV